MLIKKGSFFAAALISMAALLYSPSVQAQITHTHATTCGSFSKVTGLRLDGVDMTQPINAGAYTLRWEPVRGPSDGIITGRVWYHLDIDDLSTSANPDLQRETPVYDTKPITYYSSYTFQAGKSYRWTIYGRGGCGYGPPTSVVITVKYPPTPTFTPTKTPTPTYTPTATNTPTPTPAFCATPVDVTFVIDRSGSMASEVSRGVTRLDLAKKAAQQFITDIQQTDAGRRGVVRAGFTTYGRTLTSVLSTTMPQPSPTPYLTGSLTSLSSQILGVNKVETGTCVECGLNIANKALSLRRPDGKAAKKIAIILTDGRANRTVASNGSEVSRTIASAATLKEADLAKQKGYHYFVIGYGGTEEYTPLTQTLASGLSSYRRQNDPSQWDELMTQFLDTTCSSPSIQAVLGTSTQKTSEGQGMSKSEKVQLYNELVEYLRVKLLGQ